MQTCHLLAIIDILNPKYVICVDLMRDFIAWYNSIITIYIFFIGLINFNNEIKLCNNNNNYYYYYYYYCMVILNGFHNNNKVA